jgi:hypothetical protein
MKKRAYEIARELGLPLRDVRSVMVDLGLYLSAATPLTEERTRDIVSQLKDGSLEHRGGDDRSDTNG